MINLTIFGEPKGKGRPRFSRTGHAFTDNQTRQYENQIIVSYRNKYGAYMFDDAPLRFVVNAFFEIPKSYSKKKRELCENDYVRPTKSPDIDNICKICFDALNKVAFSDDKFIVEMHGYKYFDNVPRVEISIDEVKL